MPIAALSAGLVYTAIKVTLRYGFDVDRVNGFVSLWMIVSYVFLVGIDSMEKRRFMSLLVQTLLGTLVAVAATSLTGATAEQLAIAALIGTLLGWTADLWAKHMRL